MPKLKISPVHVSPVLKKLSFTSNAQKNAARHAESVLLRESAQKKLPKKELPARLQLIAGKSARERVRIHPERVSAEIAPHQRPLPTALQFIEGKSKASRITTVAKKGFVSTKRSVPSRLQLFEEQQAARLAKLATLRGRK